MTTFFQMANIGTVETDRSYSTLEKVNLDSLLTSSNRKSVHSISVGRRKVMMIRMESGKYIFQRAV